MKNHQTNPVLAHHLANLEKCAAELYAQTERFRAANDRLAAWLRSRGIK